MALLTLTAVCYLGIVALVAALTAAGAPLESATRTGWVVGRLGSGLLAVLDLITLAGGHRPSDLATHVAYAVCVVALPSVLTSRAVLQGDGRPQPWVIALACAATAVMLVRLAQTWG